VGTKLPVPPVDGGRLVACRTLEALAAAGAEITLVAPYDPGETGAAELSRAQEELGRFCWPCPVAVERRGRTGAALAAVATGRPASIVRHTVRAVGAEVARRLRSDRFDVVHAEQLQAFTQAAPAAEAAGLPVVLRAQNVESDLWAAAAALGGWAATWLRREARTLAAYEGEAVRRAALTVALTEPDARRLRELAGPASTVTTVPPPFPTELPPGDQPLSGEPAVVLLGSGGWLPNRDAARRFVREVWPRIPASLPGARLHLFSPEDELPAPLPAGVVPHPPPTESRQAFAPGSILVVPVRIASGLRMKILEAWARGVPVVATPEAAAGLEAEDGRELLLASDAGELVRAIGALASNAGRAPALAAAGRSLLARRFEPAEAAGRVLEAYRWSCAAVARERAASARR